MADEVSAEAAERLDRTVLDAGAAVGENGKNSLKSYVETGSTALRLPGREIEA